jgi:hypothetical protein
VFLRLRLQLLAGPPCFRPTYSTWQVRLGCCNRPSGGYASRLAVDAGPVRLCFADCRGGFRLVLHEREGRGAAVGRIRRQREDIGGFSRTGLPDGILLFFILATLLTALHAERKIQVIWPAVLLGLSVGVNWASLGLVVPVGYVLWRKGLLKLWTACGSRSSSTFWWFTLGRSPAGSETRGWRGEECESGISTPLAASLYKSTALELHPGGVGRSCCSR